MPAYSPAVIAYAARLPDITRMIWYRLYASTRHGRELASAEKNGPCYINKVP